MVRIWFRLKYYLYPPFRKKTKALIKSLVITNLIDEILESNPIFVLQSKDREKD